MGIAPMSAPAARPPLPILTSLRFFAAAEVVVYHYSADLSIPTDFFSGLAAGGYEAVTFFFVLSGFILTYVYTSARERDSFINVSTSEFWKARIARISPAYFLGLLLLLPSFVYSALIAKILPIELFILGLLLVPVFLQAWWPPAALLWNIPAWSLSIECFFYALFPALAHATARLSRNHLVIAAYFIVVAMTLVRSVMVQPSVIPLKSEAWHNLPVLVY
jgi:peptidoglycan/LPS O-acetylase OafA/YrhL